MYDYHYNVFQELYGNNIELIYIDTDSFIYHIFTDDLYNDFSNDELNVFIDFSNYPKNHSLYNENKKKMLGFLKNETDSKPIIEFIGLKTKLYSMLTETENKKTAKGLQRAVVVKYITHENYRNCLQNIVYYTKNNRIQSKNHQIYTMQYTKLIYQPFCDKRYIKNDGITSYAFGYINSLK
jgi:hypothetical protein